jgi:CRP-like cAMP-binding protein
LTPTDNKLLGALPPQDLARLSPFLTTIPMRLRLVLYKQDGEIDAVYFPSTGVLSLTRTMDDGRTAEVYAIGNEGMIGASVYFGDPLSHTEALVQVAGDVAYQLPVPVFLREMERHGAFYERIMRYYHALNLQIQQNAVCNALHHVEQRCCRWLLTTGDRVGSDQFRLTHEFLAVMLGVRRATVTVILGTLEKAGLVAAGRPGVITITNREKLIGASCECYSVVKANLERLLPTTRQRTLRSG